MQLFWTWTSPNLEFATIFVGVLAVGVFGLSFWQAVLAIVLGSTLGAVTQGILSTRGPSLGVPQLVISRLGFGYWGNALPAGLNAVTAGIGWSAVNSVSGAFALNTLTHLPRALCLAIVALFGLHDAGAKYEDFLLMIAHWIAPWLAVQPNGSPTKRTMWAPSPRMSLPSATSHSRSDSW